MTWKDLIVRAGIAASGIAMPAAALCVEDVAPDALGALSGAGKSTLAGPAQTAAIVAIVAALGCVLLLATCFPRILIVLSFLRRALGAQELPPNVVVVGLSLLLTVVLMLPLGREIYRTAYVPFAETQELDGREALRRAELPLKRYMLRQIERNDVSALSLFVQASTPSSSAASAAPLVPEELDFLVVLPAFVLSELKTAFHMGFLILLPFVLIDLVVAASLASLGMVLLPPTYVSLPLKVLVFVLVDGWTLVVSQLAASLQPVQ